MPKPTIEYLNSRRDGAARKGRTIFRPDTNAVDLRSQWRGMDAFERALVQCEHDDIAFHTFMRDLPSIAALIAGDCDSCGSLLAPGESAQDLEF